MKATQEDLLRMLLLACRERIQLQHKALALTIIPERWKGLLKALELETWASEQCEGGVFDCVDVRS